MVVKLTGGKPNLQPSKSMSNHDKQVTIDVLCELFEVLVHNIVYVRKIYPSSIFVPKRKYGVTVYQSTHPHVNEYISHCLKAVNFHAKKNQLKKLFVCFEADGKELEKYVIEILNLSHFIRSDNFALDLEQDLRDLCLKLHNSMSYLDDLPSDASFEIKLQTSAYSSLEFNLEPEFEDFAWIQAVGSDSADSEIVPLYTVQTDFLTLQSYIQKN